MSTPETQAKVVEGIGVSVLNDPSLSLEQREYLQNRWLHELQWFAKATRRSRRLYVAGSIAAVISGALTACAAGLNVFFDESSIRWLLAGLSVISAVSTGLSSRFKDWDNWKRRSMTLERLRSEGRMFQVLVGRYSRFTTKGDAFKPFAEAVERIVKEYKEVFFARKPQQKLEDAARDEDQMEV